MAEDDAGPISLGEIRNARTIAARMADVEDQLSQLRANPPAAAAEGTTEDGTALQERLDRQRADIEALKSRYNELVTYLNQQLGGTENEAG